MLCTYGLSPRRCRNADAAVCRSRAAMPARPTAPAAGSVCAMDDFAAASSRGAAARHDARTPQVRSLRVLHIRCDTALYYSSSLTCFLWGQAQEDAVCCSAADSSVGPSSTGAMRTVEPQKWVCMSHLRPSWRLAAVAAPQRRRRPRWGRPARCRCRASPGRRWQWGPPAPLQAPPG